MKLLQLSALLLFTMLAFTACNPAEDESPANSVQLGDEINMKIGEATQVTDTEISINFLSVLEDSRCPEGVTCFWEGQAIVQLEIAEADNAVIELTERAGHPELAKDTLGGYVYTLLELSPYPKEGEEITEEDYALRFTVKEL